MATGWVKAMQCRSNALDDVCQQQQQPAFPATVKKERSGPLLPLGCGLDASVHHCSPKKTSSHGGHHSPTSFHTKPIKPQCRRPPPKLKPKLPKPTTIASAPATPTLAPSPARPIACCGPFPALASLPRDHSSRQVVEMIFSSAWCPPNPFPGLVELLFRVHVHPRSASRFEEYRDAVRRLAGDADPRCAADGNEVMRFHAAPAWLSPVASSSTSTSREKEVLNERHYRPVFGASPRPSFPGGGIRTFESSGAAHRSGGGKARGRAAMLLCRVIAGRVRSGSEHHGKAAPSGITSAGESVSGDKGELVVFDRRAVLPCFLIIYRL